MPSADLDDTFNAPPPAPTVAPTREDVLNHLRWRTQQEVQTVKGPRLRTQALASLAAIDLFAKEGKELYKLGYTLTQPANENGRAIVTKWELVPVKVIVERENSQALSRATDHAIDLPRPAGMEYFPFQKAGIAFALSRPNTLFADEPGLGKTIQAIGVLNCRPELKRVLVVCPASLKMNWFRELHRWLVRPRTVFIADAKVFPDLQDGIVVINYDVLDKHRDQIRTTEWDCIIADESHYCKNADSKRTKVLFGDRANQQERAYGMSDIPALEAKCKMLLTGTPIVNRPKELFPLIEFLDPIAWTSKWKFFTRYCGACQDNGWSPNGASNLHELQEKLRASIMVRRLKRDVLKELPPKTRRVVEFAPNGEIKELIKEERALFGSEEEYTAAIEQMTLKPVIGDRPTYRKNCAIAKAHMKEVLSYIDDAIEESGKVIIFVWHREVYRLLRQHFGPKAVGMMGDTPMPERQAAVDAFQNSPAIEVIVGQIITMGTGLTLTASSRVIMMELDDVPGNVTQAEDRAHRIGQTDNVLVEHIIVTGTIDARMAKNCIEKQTIIDKALDLHK